MSRCTPNLGWNRRLKRHGGFQGIAVIREKQFRQLAATQLDAKGTIEAFRLKLQFGEPDPQSEHELKKAQNKIELAELAVEFLRGNDRRTLSVLTEEALGWETRT